MIRLKNDIPPGHQWKLGMVLENSRYGCRAKVAADDDKKKITIAVHGERRHKREYFAIIRHNIHDISGEFENLNIEEFIPLPGHTGRLVGYQELLGHEKAGKDVYFDGLLGVEFSVSEMLDSIISKSERDKERPVAHIDIKNIQKVDQRQETTQKAEQTSTQNLSIQQDIKNTLGLFNNFKTDILDEVDIEIDDEKEKKRIKNELNKTESALKELESAAADGQKQLDEGTKSRLGEFIDNLSDPESRINKALKLVSGGAKKLQDLGQTYNKMAPYFTLPSIPPVLLGDDPKA